MVLRRGIPKTYFHEKEPLRYGDMLTNAGLEIDYSEILLQFVYLKPY